VKSPDSLKNIFLKIKKLLAQDKSANWGLNLSETGNKILLVVVKRLKAISMLAITK